MSLEDSPGPQACPVKTHGDRQGPESPRKLKLKSCGNVSVMIAGLKELTLKFRPPSNGELKQNSDSDDSGSSDSEDVDIDLTNHKGILDKKYRKKGNSRSLSTSQASSVLIGLKDPPSDIGKDPFVIGYHSDSLKGILNSDSDSESE